jgi:hypothetical protein
MFSTLLTIAVVIFIYLHVAFQLKTSNEFELFESEFSKEKLEEICSFKQPVLFNHTFDIDMSPYEKYDVVVYDSCYKKKIMPLKKALRLKNHVGCDNHDFIKDTINHYPDELQPPLVTTIKYDYLFGSNVSTRLQYKNYERNYFIVINGNMKVKLSPPKQKKFLNEIKQYESQDFYSKIDPWKDPKVHFLECTVSKGQMIYIPPYWWYSFQLEKDTRVCIVHYRTAMNVVSILPELVLGYIQKQNIRVKITRRDPRAFSDGSHIEEDHEILPSRPMPLSCDDRPLDSLSQTQHTLPEQGTCIDSGTL